MPFYYRKLAGNISDVKTIKKLLADMNAIGYKKIKVVLDRGFYSAANINGLCQHHLKFLIGGKLSLQLVKTQLNMVRETMRSWNNYSQEYQVYSMTRPITWDYSQERPNKGDTLKGSRRMYLHLYFSPERALEDEQAFNSRLSERQQEQESGQRNLDYERQYAKYFEVTQTPVRGIKIPDQSSRRQGAKG